MMGYSHAMSGAAAWLAVTSTSAGFGWYAVTPTEQLSGAVLCAGAALLPDADHPSATIAYSVPVVGKAVTGALGHAAGGHRKGMHTLWSIGIVFVITLVLGFISNVETDYGTVNIAGTLSTVALTAFAVKVLRITRKWGKAWLIGILAGVGMFFFQPEASLWLPICIMIGYGAHILGDGLTTGGIAWFYPWLPRPPKWLVAIPYVNRLWQKNGYFSFPILGNTGSWRENILALIMSLYVLYALLVVTGEAWGVDIRLVTLIEYLN